MEEKKNVVKYKCCFSIYKYSCLNEKILLDGNTKIIIFIFILFYIICAIGNIYIWIKYYLLKNII